MSVDTISREEHELVDAAATAAAPPAAAPPPEWVERWRRRLVRLAGFLVVVALGIGIYRWNTAPAAIVLIAANGILLATALLNRWPRSSTRLGPWSAWVPRTFYPLGLVLGVVVAIGSTNGGARIAAIVVLAGLHAVALAAVLTLIGHGLRSCRNVSPAQLVVSALVGLLALSLAVLVDVRAVYRTFGIDGWVYAGIVAAVVVVTAAATVNYMASRTEIRLPSLSVVIGFVCLVGGAGVVVADLALMAYWRNNVPVTGPAIHELPAIPAIAGDYVALGDSYSAGEGLRPFEAFTDSDHDRLGDGCHRSHLAYSQLLRFEAPEPAARFVACSGAVINDLFNSYAIDRGDDEALVVPPQVAGGADADVGLVTVTIGGNDAVFSRVVTHCFLRTACLEATFTPPPDQPERGVHLPPAQPLEDWAHAVLTGSGARSVQSKIETVYEGLDKAYPNARIIVIGYPYLFPDRPAPWWNLTDCQTILRRFDHSERVGVRELQDELNQVLHDAAAAAGIEFVSPTAGWDQHEPCGTSGDQYTNSIKPFMVSPLTGFTIGDGGTFHPNEAGQRELAELVTCYLVAHPAPPALQPGDAPLGSVERPVPDCREEQG